MTGLASAQSLMLLNQNPKPVAAAPPASGFSIIQSNASFVNNGGSVTMTISFPSSTTAGNVFVVWVSSFNNYPLTGVTDDSGNTYQVVTQLGTGTANTAFLITTNNSSGSKTLTLTFSTAVLATVYIGELSGVHSVNTFAVNTTTFDSGTHTLPVTTTAPTMFFAGYGSSNANLPVTWTLNGASPEQILVDNGDNSYGAGALVFWSNSSAGFTSGSYSGVATCGFFVGQPTMLIAIQ